MHGGVVIVAVLLCLTRLGLLATTVAMAVDFTLQGLAFTTDLSAWYASGMIVAIVWILALAGFGFHSALAGRPLVSGAWLEE